MKTSEKLETNWKAGLWTEIKNGQGKYRLITMKTEDGRFHATHPQADNDFWINRCVPIFLAPEYIDSRDWQIIRTIHPSELMGPGYEVGQKVRIKPNAKEECEKLRISWADDKTRTAEDGLGFIKEAWGHDWIVWNKNKKDWFTFPASALEPYFEDETGVTEIAGIKYRKADIEALVKSAKDLKPLE